MIVKIKAYSEFGEDDAIAKLNKKPISTEAVRFICTIGNKEGARWTLQII